MICPSRRAVSLLAAAGIGLGLAACSAMDDAGPDTRFTRMTPDRWWSLANEQAEALIAGTAEQPAAVKVVTPERPTPFERSYARLLAGAFDTRTVRVKRTPPGVEPEVETLVRFETRMIEADNDTPRVLIDTYLLRNRERWTTDQKVYVIPTDTRALYRTENPESVTITGGTP